MNPKISALMSKQKSYITDIPLHWQIVIAMAAAVIIGLLTTPETMILFVSLYDIFDFFGTLFLNALKMIVVPLVFASIIVSVYQAAQDHAFGKMGAKTVIYYLFTGLLAVLTAVILVNWLQPGGGQSLANLPSAGTDFMGKVADRNMGDVVEIFLRMIPTNIFQAAAETQLLGLIFFATVFGYFMTRIKSSTATILNDFWQGIQEIMIRITLWIIRFTPLGVLALVGKIVMVSGADAFVPVLTFFLTVLLALAIHFFIILPLILYFLGATLPWVYMRAVSPALLTAFSTASSSSTLPLSLNCVQVNAGVSKRVSGFVLPLGATINMDGTALYECVVVIFIAQLYGIEMTYATQFLVLVLALLTSIGVAGIPAASLVAITLILTVVGLPAEAIGIVLVVDRVLDMCRTSVNVFSDTVGACVIDRIEATRKASQLTD